MIHPSRATIAALVSLPLLAAGVTACGSSGSGPAAPTIAAARTFRLTSFRPAGDVPVGKAVHLSFVIQQPSGQPLTQFRRGSGPHTGVHLILVRSDLATIIHRHPPVGADGRLNQTLTFTEPGRYRVVVDVYPRVSAGSLPNFQLFKTIRVGRATKARPLPPFRPAVTVAGYRFVLQGYPRLRAIEPDFLKLTVTTPAGKPAQFTPWYGAIAHAIFFHQGNLDYFHTHVCAPGASGCASLLGGAKVTGRSATPGQLTVGVLVPEAGLWRLFLQCQVDGKILTAPFTLRVR